IYDIKPYVPYADCRPEATQGFAPPDTNRRLEVEIPEELLNRVPKTHRAALQGVLAQDPRPAYQRDPERIYGFGFAGLEVRFSVQDGVLRVEEVRPEH